LFGSKNYQEGNMPFLYKHFRLFFILIFLLGILWAGVPKAESDLIVKLAASEQSRAILIKEKLQLQAAMERLTKTRMQATEVSKSASLAASKDASLAQDSAASMTIIVQQAALAASTAAMVAQQQASKFNTTSMTMVFVQLLVLFGILAGFVNGALRENRRHKWAVQEAKNTFEMAKSTQKTMNALEINTNSIKDALVKVTGEKAYAEGLKDGVEKTQNK
jgi:hypothetical protein